MPSLCIFGRRTTIKGRKATSFLTILREGTKRTGGDTVEASIWVAIITGLISLIGTVITVTMANKQTLNTLSEQSKLADEKINGRIKVIEEKIDNLSKRVEKHNSMVERTYSLESRVSVLEAKKGA
jgi:cell division protein FtsN